MKNPYYILKKSENEFIIYNNAKIETLKIDKKGKFFFDLILKHKSIEKCKPYLKDNDDINFIDFINKLVKLDFFNDEPKSEVYLSEIKNIKPHISQFYFHLTNKCNLKCVYCYNADKRILKNDLTLNDWKRIFNKLENPKEIIITGGEPFLFNEISSLVEFIKEKNNTVIISILSNGMVDYQLSKFQKLFKIINKLTISCDKLADDSKVRKGFKFNYFDENIKFIKKKYPKISLEVTSVQTKGMLRDILDVNEYCKMHEISFRRLLRIPNSKEEDEINLIPTIAEQSIISNLIMNEKFRYKKLQPIFICGAGNSVISIDFNGDCYPCQSFHVSEFKFGNLLENSLSEILNTKTAISFREKLIESYYKQNNCSKCNLRNICTGGCPATTYNLENDLNASPDIMCKHYKSIAKSKLLAIEF